MDITRFLPNNEYQAAVGANSPSASNVFATVADTLYGGDGTLSGNRTVTGGGNNLTFSNVGVFNAFASNASLVLGTGPGDWILSGAGSGQVSASATLAIQSFSGNVNLLGTNVTIQSLIYPNADGLANHVMKTDGAGNLSFVDINTLISVSSIYTANGTIGSGRVVTLTDTVAFGGALLLNANGSSTFNDSAVASGDVIMKGLADPRLFVADASSDRVGIGTTAAPQGKLNVQGNTNGAAQYTFVTFNSVGGAGIYHRDDGFIGLRTNAPSGFSENVRMQGQATVTNGGLLVCAGTSATNTYADLNSGLVNSGAVFGFNAATNTNNVNFKVFNNTDTDLLVVSSSGGDGKVGVMTADGNITSTFTVTGDMEVIGQTEGLILQDRTSGTRYRVYIDATGVLHTETA